MYCFYVKKALVPRHRLLNTNNHCNPAISLINIKGGSRSRLRARACILARQATFLFFPLFSCASNAAYCTFFLQTTRENNVKMFKDMREAVDSVDPDRDTFAYSDT